MSMLMCIIAHISRRDFYKVAVVYMFSSSFMCQSRNISASLYLTTRLPYATLAKLTSPTHIYKTLNPLRMTLEYLQIPYRLPNDIKNTFIFKNTFFN